MQEHINERVAKLEAVMPIMNKSLENLNDNIKDLKETIDKSKGAFWALMAVSSAFGALTSIIISLIFGRH